MVLEMADETAGKSHFEEFQVKGENLLAKVREVINDGNAKRVILKNEDGETLLEVPLTAGVAVTVLTAALAPALVAIGAVAALVTDVTLVVERGES